jgi:hypothetical protein
MLVAIVLIGIWSWTWRVSRHVYFSTGARLAAAHQARMRLSHTSIPWRATVGTHWEGERGLQTLELPRNQGALPFSSFFSGSR